MRLCLLAPLLFILALPAHAEDKPSKPEGRCIDLARSLGFVDATKDTVFEDLPDGCRVSDFYVSFGPYARYHTDEVLIRSPALFTGARDFDVPPEDFEIPATMEITVTGLLFAPDTGSALNDYIIETQSEPMGIHFDYEWNKATGTFRLNDLSLTGFDDSSIAIAATATGFDQTQLEFDSIKDLPGALKEASLTLKNARFFSLMTNPALLGGLPESQDPRAAVASYQQAATAFINGLPNETISEESKYALETLINSFPRLRGDYTLHLEAAPAMPFSRLTIDNLDDILALLSKFTLDVTHQPES